MAIGNNFAKPGNFFKCFLKRENKYMYVPAKSGHTKHTIKNFILSELKMYVRYNTVEHIFFKIWNTYFARLFHRINLIFVK